MKTLVCIATVVAMSLLTQIVTAQEEDKANGIEQLNQQKEQIVEAEKNALKKEVEKINDRLINDEITQEEAQRLKEEIAKKHALNIENKIAIIDNKIALVERNGWENGSTRNSGIWIGEVVKNDEDKRVQFNISFTETKEKEIKYDIRTRSNLLFAVGLNNAIVDGQSLDNSDYKIAGSRFFELGWVWKTRVFKNTNVLRLKYGISYTSNGLKPTDNRYFVENDNETVLEDFEIELEKSKFRMDNLVVPIHLELGGSKLEKTEKSIRYHTSDHFKLGFGGYLGANISTRQKLKYTVDGEKVKDKIKRSYNSSDLIYGLSAYIGFGDTSLYAKYDMSPIFKNAEIEQNNISLGVRFDL
ncbi:coiled-coil domain-containing protein [Aquimarina pacifica]|uniref:coiled-coil domain-containing protein n=1 Tax=Aquimarina pacifica TaxID=1296415 RepID=UPI000471CB9B|nr:hypothetical protein [Aquimarina pacifica]